MYCHERVGLYNLWRGLMDRGIRARGFINRRGRGELVVNVLCNGLLWKYMDYVVGLGKGRRDGSCGH